MTTCKQCREFEKCEDDAFINGAKFDPNESVKYCTGFEPITNADRIRAMSDEELSASNYIPCPYDDDGYGECKYGWHKREQTCEECKFEWLKQPAEEGDGNG